jgi:hypothetical protein
MQMWRILGLLLSKEGKTQTQNIIDSLGEIKVWHLKKASATVRQTMLRNNITNQ